MNSWIDVWNQQFCKKIVSVVWSVFLKVVSWLISSEIYGKRSLKFDHIFIVLTRIYAQSIKQS